MRHWRLIYWIASPFLCQSNETGHMVNNRTGVLSDLKLEMFITKDYRLSKILLCLKFIQSEIKLLNVTVCFVYGIRKTAYVPLYML